MLRPFAFIKIWTSVSRAACQAGDFSDQRILCSKHATDKLRSSPERHVASKGVLAEIDSCLVLRTHDRRARQVAVCTLPAALILKERHTQIEGRGSPRTRAQTAAARRP